MEVLVVDPGARGHALARKISESSLVDRIFMAPGNTGTEEIAENTDISHVDLESQIDFVRKQKKIGMIVVAADDPLAMGVVDAFEEEFKDRDIKIWGPNQSASKIERSKAFSKQLMKSQGVDTADFTIAHTMQEAIRYADTQSFPLFIKMDQLFGGKGVSKAEDLFEVEDILCKYIGLGRFNRDNPVVIEQESPGVEISLQAFCDGEDYLMVPFAMKDHKTIYDGDKGPMTGGMGVIGPVPGLSTEDINRLGEKFVAPVLRELSRQGRPFRGMLYPGLRGSQCLEYNARPGDPEAQVWLSLMSSDLVEVMLASHECNLVDIKDSIKWRKAGACCLVLASRGYPEDPQKGAIIEGLASSLPADTHLLHAGTKKDEKNTIVDGGRVLNIVAVDDSVEEAINKAYQTSGLILFDGKQQRGDIGQCVTDSEFNKGIEQIKSSI
jgi:phosphoribosylamine---glycine ligase